MRIGQGYDVHRFVPNRDLIIGGIPIPYSMGLEGHSDADVLTHAIMDALLGAAALGDIGEHFPDTDEKYKGISSITLLKKVASLLDENNYIIVNIDCTIMAQEPKLNIYKKEIKDNISKALGLEEDRINIKATTTEKLGFVGRIEGIASNVICLLEEVSYFDEATNNRCGGCSGCGK